MAMTCTVQNAKQSGTCPVRCSRQSAAGCRLPALVVGLLGAFVTMRLLGSLLFGVTATDPTVYLGVVAVQGRAISSWPDSGGRSRGAWIRPLVTWIMVLPAVIA